MSTTIRNFGLDLYRTLAICFVLFGHSGFILTGTKLDGFPFFRMIDGVDLFFVLSGFLIGGILLKEMNLNEPFTFRRLVLFWKKRWFRTLPNYFLILLIYYTLISFKILDGDIEQFNWKFLFFLHNFSSGFQGFFWESWSLSVEEWFYLLVPFIFYFTLKLLSAKNTFILTALVLIIVPLLLRHLLTNEVYDNYWFDVKVRKVVIFRIDSIAYGLIAAWLNYYYSNFWKKYRFHFLIVGIGFYCLLINFTNDVNETNYKIFYFSISSFTCFLFLPFFQFLKSTNFIFIKIITHLSKISYSMYLINLGLVASIINKYFIPNKDINPYLLYFFFWFSVIVISTLIYYTFERPILKYRDNKLK